MNPLRGISLFLSVYREEFRNGNTIFNEDGTVPEEAIAAYDNLTIVLYDKGGEEVESVSNNGGVSD